MVKPTPSGEVSEARQTQLGLYVTSGEANGDRLGVEERGLMHALLSAGPQLDAPADRIPVSLRRVLQGPRWGGLRVSVDAR